MRRLNGIHHHNTLDNQNDRDVSIKRASLVLLRYDKKNMRLHSMNPV
jgi:hypothetical protein